MFKVISHFHVFFSHASSLFASGWFFKSNPIRATLATSLLSTTVDDVDEERVSSFTASGQRYKQLCIEGLRREMCAKTDDDGSFEKQFQVSDEDMQRVRMPGGTGGKVEYLLSTVDRKHRSKGEIFLCDDNGISIISDIVSVEEPRKTWRNSALFCCR
jgi:hypothetical protein